MIKKIPFVKYTLCGNKFAIVDETDYPIFTESEKSLFADPSTDIYYGVGSDNFLVIQPYHSEILKGINEKHHYWKEIPSSENADYIFRMFEPDGKEAFSCGNGLMCIADYLYRKSGITSARIMTEIPTATPKVLTIGTDAENKMSWANMGCSRQIPSEMANPSVTKPYDDKIRVIENIRINFPNNELIGFKEHISLTLTGFLIFTGEPHLVVFTESGLSSGKVANYIFNSSFVSKTEIGSRLIHKIGISLNKDYPEYFPRGINVNFVRILDRSGIIEYRCFERGINRETWACGTGAVATATVASKLNMIDNHDVTIFPHLCRLHKPGSRLYVKKCENDYFLYGKPLLLFEGNFFLE